MQYNVKTSANVDGRSKLVKDKILIGIANLNKYILVPILYSSLIQIFFFLLRIAKMDEKVKRINGLMTMIDSDNDNNIYLS